jgi:hypothetical protein
MRKVPLQGFDGLKEAIGLAEPPAGRLCDHPTCAQLAEHRAPRSRESLNEYLWFCLEHVTLYNRAWNYYAGLSEKEVERLIVSDSMWQRPTWPLGSRGQQFGTGSAEPDDAFGMFEEERQAERRQRRANDTGRGHAGARARARLTEEQRAFATLEVDGTIDMAALKAHYRSLVKRYHPDANGGDKAAEDRLKQINEAYHTLKSRLAS